MDELAGWRMVEGHLGEDAHERLLVTLGSCDPDAVLSFWSWLDGRVTAYSAARGLCVTDGLVGEAVEIVLTGRAEYTRACGEGNRVGDVLGDDGMQFCERLSAAYYAGTSRHLPALGATRRQVDSSSTFGVVYSMDGLPASVVRGHDAAFAAFFASEHVRESRERAGIEELEIEGLLSHDAMRGWRVDAPGSAHAFKRRGRSLVGSFTWPTAELLGDGFAETVARVRALVDAVADAVEGLPRAAELTGLGDVVDPDPYGSAWALPPRGLIGGIEPDAVGVSVLEAVLPLGGEREWVGVVQRIVASGADEISWTRFAAIASAEGVIASEAIGEMSDLLRLADSGSASEVEDRVVASAILTYWPARAAAVP